MTPHSNTLYYGDNLPVLREHFGDASVDLIYLDPPFNSNRNYNVLFKDEQGNDAEAQMQAFTDTWRWNQAAERTYHELVTAAPAQIGTVIGALRAMLGPSPMLAYLVMMAARLVELHRVLKPTGSLYLHCDPTASHYLKIILDTVFGPRNFRNEIIWRRTRAHNDRKISRFGAVHDTLLFYAKSETWLFNPHYTTRDAQAPKTHDLYRHTDGKLYRKGDCRAPGGRGPRFDWNGHVENWRFTEDNARQLEAAGLIVYSASGIPRILRPVDLDRGSPLQDLWVDIDAPNSGSAEILGYPTQKPLALLDRIIEASSNPGDVILDPFCGCGTAIAAAEQLGRRWLGIDITHLAISLQKSRLREMFPGIAFNVVGEPPDISAARQLALDNRYQFQWWALGLVEARPVGGEATGKQGKKGADRGIDGVINFIDDASAKPKRAIIQVKSGHNRLGDVRDLRGTIEREGAALGALLTLESPTREMCTEAAAAGFYRSPGWGKDFPRLQILTIEELLTARRSLQMPPAWGTFKLAPRADRPDGEQQPFAW